MSLFTLPPCLLGDFNDRIELTFADEVTSEEEERITRLLQILFPWITVVHWYTNRTATILKPR